MTGPAREDHHCPACGTAQPSSPRYPWHLCSSCRDAATDGAGRALEFGNTALSGGFAYRYVEGGDWTPCRGVVALARGRPVLVHEARMGGVVAEPLTEPPVPGEGIHDLRGTQKVGPEKVERERATPRVSDRKPDPFSTE